MLHLLFQIYLAGLIPIMTFLLFIFWASQGFKLSAANARLVMFNGFLWPIMVSMWLYEIVVPAVWHRSLVRKIRDSHFFAFWQGLWEHLSTNGNGGRTHKTDQGWNEAYDRGMNWADRLLRIKGHG